MLINFDRQRSQYAFGILKGYLAASACACLFITLLTYTRANIFDGSFIIFIAFVSIIIGIFYAALPLLTNAGQICLFLLYVIGGIIAVYTCNLDGRHVETCSYSFALILALFVIQVPALLIIALLKSRTKLGKQLLSSGTLTGGLIVLISFLEICLLKFFI